MRLLFNAIDGLPCDCKFHPVFYSGTASVLPGCVERCKVRKVCLFVNPNIGQRLRVSKYGIEVIANSVRVFSTRGVTRPDWDVKFCQIILPKSRRSYDVGQQIDKSFDFQSCLGNDSHLEMRRLCRGVENNPQAAQAYIDDAQGPYLVGYLTIILIRRELVHACRESNPDNLCA